MIDDSAPGLHAAAPARRAAAAAQFPYRGELWLLLAPYLVGAVLLVGAPAMVSLVLAFANYDALSPPAWAGLLNFRLVFADPLFWIALKNSLYFVALAVPLRVLAALALALLLQRRRRGIGLYRAAVYLPTVIPDTAYALTWLWIVNPLYGPLNLILRALGLPAPAWLVEPGTARLVIVMMSVLQIGEGFVVLLAGLQNVPAEYYAAAAVDGASGLQALRHITLPLLAPWLLLLTFRDAILSLQSTFTPAFLMTGGGPYYATLFLPLLAYEEAFDRLRFGPGSAIMLMMFLLTGLILAALFWFFRRRGYGDER